MGCDWYFISSISVLGFSINSQDYQKYKHLLDQQYGSLIYRLDNDTKIFIYDKDTAVYGSFDVPGPYEITDGDAVTIITKQDKITMVFSEKIQQMKNKFNVLIDECGYYLLLTTRGLGEFDSFLLGESKPFASIKTYEEYYGYDDSENSE